MIFKKIHKLFKVLEEFFVKGTDTNRQSSHDDCGIESFRVRIRRGLGGIKNILKNIHESKTVEKRNIHQLGKEVKNIDSFIETKLRELFFKITNG